MAPQKRSKLAHKHEIKSWREMTPFNVSVGTMLHNLTGSWRYVRPYFEDKTPACQNACPAGSDIEGWIKLLQQGEKEKAYWHLKREQPFPAILGRICVRFCEKPCNRQYLDKRISINDLERFVGDQVQLEIPPSDLPDYHGKSLAVVGSGPAELAAAYFARYLGYKVTIIEAASQMGGILLQSIAANRLPQEILAGELEGLKNMGLVMRTGVEIGKDVSIQELRNEFDYIFPSSTLSAGHDPESPAKDQNLFVLDKNDHRIRNYANGETFAPARTVVQSVAAGKRAVVSMDVHRLGLKLDQVLSSITIGHGPALSFSRYKGWPGVNPLVPNLNKVVTHENIVYYYFQKMSADAKSDEPKKAGALSRPSLTESEARAETERCLHCGRCMECDNCLIFCPEATILTKGPDRFGYDMDYDYCKGCGLCQAECPRWAISMMDENIPLDPSEA